MTSLRRIGALVGLAVLCGSLPGCVMRTPVGVTRDGDAVAFVVKPCSARRISACLR